MSSFLLPQILAAAAFVLGFFPVRWKRCWSLAHGTIPTALNDLGRACEQVGDSERAVAVLQQAVEFDSTLCPAQVALRKLQQGR